MQPLRYPAWRCVLLAVGVLAVSCGSEPESSTGGLQLSLELVDGEQVDAVAYEITRDGMSPMGGTIDTSAPGATASVELFGLAPGEGYRLAMSATSVDGEA